MVCWHGNRADGWAGKAILDTTAFSEPRSTDKLPAFLNQFAAASKGGKDRRKPQKLSSAPNIEGSPHTLVIAGAGLRAADLTRVLRVYQTKECMVAKLFAKHIKLTEAIETVSKSRIGIGVGTPQRIIDLLEDGAFCLCSVYVLSTFLPCLALVLKRGSCANLLAGALKSQCIERIVLDASHIDQKKRGLLDMKETQVPLVKLLTRAAFKDRYGIESDGVELVFF